MMRPHRRFARKMLDRDRAHHREGLQSRPLLRGVEPMEPRLVFNLAPVFVGAVYIEEDTGSDKAGGDSIHISFEGGAPGSQLTSLEINGDQGVAGFGEGDVFFDTRRERTATGPGRYGAEEAFDLQIVSNRGIDKITPIYADGTMLVRLEFEGFDVGDQLVISIDVDEVEDFDPQETNVQWINDGFDPIATGVEFQGSTLTGFVASPGFHDAEVTATFYNRYDDRLDASPLRMPADDFGGKRDRSAGAVGQTLQEPRLANLGGHVYHDANQNGRRDATEEGIAGVVVRAIPVETILTQNTLSVVTDATGAYHFRDLMPGTYRLVEEQPKGYLDGLDARGTVDGQAVGRAINPGDAIEDILLAGGSQGVDYDFGELLPVALHGRVHLATKEGDCFSEDVEHAPVEGARIELLDAQGRVVTDTVTDAQGRYAFVGLLPGTYSVREITPEGLFDGGAIAGRVDGQPRGVVVNSGLVSEIVLGSGEEVLDVDFCEKPPVTIRGRVQLATKDGDCFTESINHRPVANAVVRLLDARRQVIAETLTDADGRYVFQDLEPGTYAIEEITPEGLLDGGARSGLVDGEERGRVENSGLVTAIVLGPGEVIHHVDFCEKEPVSIRGSVHLATRDGDCFSDDVEHAPLADVEIRLYDALDQLVMTTYTDAQGKYFFSQLPPGEFRIVEVTPPGLLEGGAQAGEIDGQTIGTILDANTIADVWLGPGQNGVDYEFCERLPGTLAGTVYHDRDLDGVRSGQEEGLAQVVVHLLNSAGDRVATQVTDSQGRYSFSGLVADSYRVIEEQPTGWLDGRDSAGTIAGQTVGVAINPGDRIEQILLGWGDQAIDYDFGELRAGRISGDVHLSSPDGDCFSDWIAHEPLPDVTIQLFDDQGKLVAETQTDAQGKYEFRELVPGRYVVRELTPPHVLEGGAQAGESQGRTVGVVVDANTVSHLELGSDAWIREVEFCEHLPASLDGYVYHDQDEDGIRDSAEIPIGDVELILFGEQDVEVARTRTDALGRFRFDRLEAGTYRLVEVQPNAWADGQDAAGTVRGEVRGTAINPGDTIEQIVLAWGDAGVDYAFGELMASSLAGIVHTDLDADCLLDEDERPIAGVLIELLAEDGSVVATRRTDQEGRFEFTGLRPAVYHLREVQPEGYFQGGERAGTGGGDVSQVDQIRAIQIGSGVDLVAYAFCEIPPSTISGYVFLDGPPIALEFGQDVPEDLPLYRDGLLTPDDQRLAGVTLELRDGRTGLPLNPEYALPGIDPSKAFITQTDARGYYEFTGIRYGNFAVYEKHPTGYFDGLDTAGTVPAIAINWGNDDALEVRDELEVDPRFDAIVKIVLYQGQSTAENNFSELQVARPVVPIFPRPQEPFPEALPEIARPQFPAQSVDVLPQNVPLTSFGRVSRAGASSWHLSVIDGGQPRGTGQIVANGGPVWNGETVTHSVSYPQTPGAQLRWSLIVDGNVETVRIFGNSRGWPIAGDFNGDGDDEMGIYLEGHWFIDVNGNGQWDEQDLWAKLGYEYDQPVVGDWNGDGKDDIGVFGRAWAGDPEAVRREPGLPDRQNRLVGRPKNLPPEETNEVAQARRELKLTAYGTTRSDVVDHVFVFGEAHHSALVGDWNGDGISTIATFHRGRWQIDVDGDGQSTVDDRVAEFGDAGDIPLAGDFNGDGVDEIAIIHQGRLIIDTNRNYRVDDGDQTVPLPAGVAPGRPVVADWNHDGRDDVAFTGESMQFVEIDPRE